MGCLESTHDKSPEKDGGSGEPRKREMECRISFSSSITLKTDKISTENEIESVLNNHMKSIDGKVHLLLFSQRKGSDTGRWYISFQCSFTNFDKFDDECKELAQMMPESAMEYAIAGALEGNADFNRDLLNAFIDVNQYTNIQIEEVLIAPKGYNPDVWTTKEFEAMQAEQEQE